MIFGPNESSRRDLFLEKNSKSRNNRKVFEKLRKIFENFFEKFFERCNLMGDVILSKTSLGPTRLANLLAPKMSDGLLLYGYQGQEVRAFAKVG